MIVDPTKQTEKLHSTSIENQKTEQAVSNASELAQQRTSEQMIQCDTPQAECQSRKNKKFKLKKKLEKYGVNSETADLILKSMNRELVNLRGLPSSLVNEILAFITENVQCEEKLIRTKLLTENVDPVLIKGVLNKTIDKESIQCVIDVVSLPSARMVSRWLGETESFALKSKKTKLWNASKRQKYASSTEFRTAKQRRSHKNALERLKNVSARLRNRVLARQSMDRRLLIKEVREKNQERARARERMHRIQPVL